MDSQLPSGGRRRLTLYCCLAIMIASIGGATFLIYSDRQPAPADTAAPTTTPPAPADVPTAPSTTVQPSGSDPLSPETSVPDPVPTGNVPPATDSDPDEGSQVTVDSVAHDVSSPQDTADQALQELLPWFADPPSFGHSITTIPIREVYMKDPVLGRKLAETAWLHDGIDVFEHDVVYGLQHLLDWDLAQSPRTNLADQMLAYSVQTPLRSSNIHAIKSLGDIKYYNVDSFKELIKQPWFVDGLNTEELAFIIVLDENMFANQLYGDLLAERHTLKRTIDLPISGPTTVWIFSHSPFASDDPIMTRTETALRGSEHLFKSGGLLTDIPVLLVDASAYPSEVGPAGTNFGDSTMIVRESASTPIAGMTYHEISHFYFVPYLNSISFWLVEGGANFATTYFSAWETAGDWPETLTADDGAAQWCEGQGVMQIADLNEPGADVTCMYSFGEYFITKIFNTVGQDAFRSALREMYLNFTQFEYHSRPGRDEGQTEEQIFQIFLKHTPSGKQQALKDLYRELHGGSFVD